MTDIPSNERPKLREIISRLAMDEGALTTVSSDPDKPNTLYVFTTESGHQRVRDKLAVWNQGDHSVPLGTPNPPRRTLKLEEMREASVDGDEAGSVEIKIVDVDGKPMPDTLITFAAVSGNSNPEKIHVNVNVPIMNQTDDSGTVIAEHVPPGAYKVSIRTDKQWTATSTAMVTKNKRVKLAFTTPSSDRDARFAMDTKHGKLTEMASRLPFGEYKESQGRGVFIGSAVSEKLDYLGDYAAFPSLNNGIESIGYRVQLTVETEVPQESGDSLNWTWGKRFYGSDWLIDARGATPIVRVEQHETRGIGNGQRLNLNGGNEYLGFWKVFQDERVPLPHMIQVPVGIICASKRNRSCPHFRDSGDSARGDQRTNAGGGSKYQVAALLDDGRGRQ